MAKILWLTERARELPVSSYDFDDSFAPSGRKALGPFYQTLWPIHRLMHKSGFGHVARAYDAAISNIYRKRIHCAEFFDGLEPMEGAVEEVQRDRENDRAIAFTTGRSQHEQRWMLNALYRWNVPVDLCITTNREPKAPTLALIRARSHVDDYLPLLGDVHAGRDGLEELFIMYQPWNAWESQALAAMGATLVRSWPEITAHRQDNNNVHTENK